MSMGGGCTWSELHLDMAKVEPAGPLVGIPS